MTSTFKLFAQSCGLTLIEATRFTGTKTETARSWWFGRRNVPETVLDQLVELSIKQDVAAQEILLLLHSAAFSTTQPDVCLRVIHSDMEARAAGWPSASTHMAVLRRVAEKLPRHLAARLKLSIDVIESV